MVGTTCEIGTHTNICECAYMSKKRTAKILSLRFAGGLINQISLTTICSLKHTDKMCS